MNAMDRSRLLPWTSPDGKPCYLLDGSGTGYVSRLADRVEAEQMSSAGEFIVEARRLLVGRAWTPGEIHLLAADLNDHLVRVHRVSRSRGARLRLLIDGPDEDGGDVEGEGAPPVA